MKVDHLPISLLLVANAAAIPLLRRDTLPTVVDHSNQITFVGNSSYGVESFYNIKFGQDTSGANRFKAPTPFIYSTNTIVNATVPGAACPQQKVPIPGFPVFDNVTNISEDCLTLRIDRPANVSSDAKLPVMVWIYGGGFEVGQIYDSAYNPTLLVASAAAKRTPVIFVAINYRVGIFGFAATPAISLDDLNAGLLDQRLALLWVQKNINLFGGDADNVTIFGESAGADSVGLHLVSYAGNTSMAPPIRRAIMESGGPTSKLGVTGNSTANNTAIVINRTKCTSSAGNHTAELSCLRSVSLTDLTTISTDYALSLNALGGLDTYNPTVPSTILPSPPSILLSTGSFHKNISLISGWTENDGSIFAPPPSKLTTETALVAWLTSTSNLTNTSIATVLTLYPSTSFPTNTTLNVSSNWYRASRINRDRSRLCPSLLINSAMANYSTAATTITNYLYTLNTTLFTPFFKAENTTYLGVPHFSDIGFVFDQASIPSYGATADQITLANRMSGSWAAFATNGNPVRGGSLATNTTVDVWTTGVLANSSLNGQYGVRILGGPGDAMTTLDQDTVARCRFWNSRAVLDMNET